MQGHKKWILAAAALAVLGLLIWLAWRFYPSVQGLMEPERMARFQEKLRAFGGWGVPVLAGMMFLQVLSGIIPALPIQICAGLTYGAIGGLLTCLAGNIAGTTVVFLAVKRYGQPLVDRVFPQEKQEKLSFLRDASRLRQIVFILYLIPALPKEVFTYLAALTPIRFRDFITISTVARIPMILCSTFASGALMEGDYTTAAVVFCLACLLGISGMLLGPRVMERMKRL